MKLLVFAVWDDKAKSYLPPFFMPMKGMAVRTFGDCVNDPKHQWSLHPEDYTLFSFGSFDADSGKFETSSAEVMVSALQVKKEIVS